MKTLISTLILGAGLVLSGCEDKERKLDHRYTKEIDSKIRKCELLINLNNSIKKGNCKEASSYVDTLLVSAFNEIESNYSSLKSESYKHILSDSIRENLNYKLELIQNKIWNRAR